MILKAVLSSHTHGLSMENGGVAGHVPVPGNQPHLPHQGRCEHTLQSAAQVCGELSTPHWPQRSDPRGAGCPCRPESQHRPAFQLLTSLEIARCFSAKCMACSWFPRAVYAFPKLQHALPSPILRNDQSKLAITRREGSVVTGCPAVTEAHSALRSRGI